MRAACDQSIRQILLCDAHLSYPIDTSKFNHSSVYMMASSYARRLWFDFRMGHSVYLIFILSFANFMLIFHRLLIERIDWLNELLGDLWLFVILFLVLYIPVAITVGAWHRRNQIKVETAIGLLNSPLHAKMFRILIDMQSGKASKEEIDQVRKMLKDIEDKADSN